MYTNTKVGLKPILWVLFCYMLYFFNLHFPQLLLKFNPYMTSKSCPRQHFRKNCSHLIASHCMAGTRSCVARWRGRLDHPTNKNVSGGKNTHEHVSKVLPTQVLTLT